MGTIGVAIPRDRAGWNIGSATMLLAVMLSLGTFLAKPALKPEDNEPIFQLLEQLVGAARERRTEEALQRTEAALGRVEGTVGTIDDKVDRLITAPYDAALSSLRHAKRADNKTVRRNMLFLAIEKLEDAAAREDGLRKASALFYEGSCFDLLGDKGAALDAYRQAFDEASRGPDVRYLERVSNERVAGRSMTLEDAGNPFAYFQRQQEEAKRIDESYGRALPAIELMQVIARILQARGAPDSSASLRDIRAMMDARAFVAQRRWLHLGRPPSA